jgi:hypothetical protein
MLKVLRVIFIFAVITILAACHSTKSKSKTKTPHKGEFFSLTDCINATLEHRTAYEIYILKERIAGEKSSAEAFKKLQDLIKYFDNDASRNTGQINITEIEQIINILNFSMAYLNAWQREDRSLITVEEKQTAEQNLKFAVSKIYFKMALTQYAIKETEKIILKCEKMEKENAKPPEGKTFKGLGVMDRRKYLVRLEKSLVRYRRNYQDLCRELRMMTGLVKNKKVDIKCLENIRFQVLPDINTLEKIALLKRPEFSGMNIAINDVRKTVIQILPGHKIYDNPRMFYLPYWREIAVCAAYAALKLPPDLEKYLDKISLKEKESTRKLALAIGITAQVRMVHVSIMQEKERYELSDKTYKAYKRHFDISNKSLSEIEKKRLELDIYECSINRITAMCEYHIACCRLLNVLGVDSLDPADTKILMNKIKLSEEKEKRKPLDKAIIQIYLKTVNKLKSKNNQHLKKSRRQGQSLKS